MYNNLSLYLTHLSAVDLKGKPLQELTDIEEICMVCEPVPEDAETGVLRYPMKAEKKKAREELAGTGVGMISKGDAVAGFLVKIMIEAGEGVERVAKVLGEGCDW